MGKHRKRDKSLDDVLTDWINSADPDAIDDVLEEAGDDD